MIEELLWTYNVMVTGYEPADTWDDIAANIDDEGAAGGDRVVNWKKRGYSTILDVLMVYTQNHSMIAKQTLVECNSARLIHLEKAAEPGGGATGDE